MSGIMNTLKGVNSGQQRLENLGGFEEYVDRMLGQGAAKLTGQTDEEYYNNPNTLKQYFKQYQMREKPALADRLSESNLDVAAKSFTSPIRETVLLPTLAGGFDAYDTADKATRIKNIVKEDIDPKDIEQLAAILGKDPTNEDIENFIYQNSAASNTGYGLGLIAEGPALAALGAGKLLKGALKFFLSKPKTTGATIGAGASISDADAKIKNVKNLFVPKPTNYADVDMTSQDFLDYVTKFKTEKSNAQNLKQNYVAFNKVRNNFFKKNKNYDGVEEAWNYITDFTAQQKKLPNPKKGATKAYTNVMQDYIDEVEANGIINETTGKQITLDDWFIPKNVDGSIASNPNQARKRLVLGRAEWNQIRNDKRVKKMEGYDTVGKQQVDRLLLYMRRGGEDNFKPKYDQKGNIIGYKVLNKNEPGYGNTYYKTGYVNKNPNKKLTSIKEHPTWQLQQDMMEIAKDVRFATLDDNISQQIFDVVGDFSIYGKSGKTFGLNQLGDYLYTLDKYKDPMRANLEGYKSLGKKNIIEIHHTKGVKQSATDPKFLQLVTKEENAIANSIASSFSKNLERVGLDEAMKIAREKAAKVPNIRLAFEVDGKLFKIGKNTKSDKIVDRVQNEIKDLWSKHLQDKPEEIKKMAETFSLRAAGKNKGGRIGFTEGGTDLDKKIKEYQDMGLELKDAIDEAVKDELAKRGKGVVGGSGTDIETGDNIFKRTVDKVKGAFEPVKDLEQLDTVKKVQQDIKVKYKNVLDQVQPSVEKKLEEIKKDARDTLRNERPVKFKSSEFANVAEEFVFKPFGTILTAPAVGALNAIEYSYNKARAGVENDIDMKEKFPDIYKLFNYYTSGIGPTPDEQTYIGFLDETIRSVQKGGQNLTYGILDLAATIPDFAFNSEIQERLQKSYNENAFADPETFLGDVGAILTEFAVPGTVAFKFINFLRRGLGLADKSTEGMKIGAKLATQISNVSKRVATVGGAGFLGEFVGGSPYNSVTRMNPDDPLLFDDSLADMTGEEKYRYIDTTGMSGKELTLANLTNRIRFGTEGAIVGGLFPILGPALWKTTKYGAIKPAAYVAGKSLQAVNYLAIKPASYLLARTPVVAQTGQIAAKALGVGANFLGKDVVSRAVLGVMGTPTFRQLPAFKDWRMFEVTSTDPLERNLKKYDNFLGLFRDSGNQSANRFFITGSTERGIKAISRKIEKQLDIVEKRAYDLQRGFLKDYNSKTTSPAKQDYYLDQVLAYLKGQVKLADLPDVLQEGASALNKTFIQIKREFADVLPDGAGLKDFLMSNLKSYSRASFATFTNPLYRPDSNTYNKAVDFMVDRIKSNASMVDAALAAARSGTNGDVAIKDFARKQVESILQRGKVDNRDPLDVLSYIARENLKMDDLVVQTGEELPDVIRKLMGQENNLRASVMTTATDLASQTANLKMYDRLTDLGLKEGWLFRSADEAIAAGVVTPKLIGPRLPGLGKLNSKISEAYGGENIVNSIVGTTGLLDPLLKNELYQSLIAYKAFVQSGKTVYSPATQTRNFGSAGFFPLQSGHIGGAASVQDAFKIILDDVFGAGKTLNEQQLIDRITKKIELGVLDENVVVSELRDVLKDLKASNFKSFGELAKRIDETKLSETATRLYAGGDNVWKWYGHEFVMSQLKNGFKSIDEIKDAYKSTFKVDIDPKTIQEGVEQYAAALIRDTYPTYSKVPKLIQYIRRFPFVGNFVSFPAEILRTTFTTSALAAKHIASNNATLRELGYRTLMGQYITYGGIGLGTTYLGNLMSNMTDQQMKDLKMYFAPEFMRNSDLIPMTPMKDGVVKVFDNSRYFPYDLITATTSNLMNRIFTSQEKLDPDQIETDMFKDFYNYSGPLADLAGGTFFGTAIGYEPALTFLRGGITKSGSKIYADTDTTVEKFDKMFAYTFETINPGFVRTLQNMYKSFAGMLTGTGQPIKPEDEFFKILGGSAVTLDVSGSFRYKIGKLKSSFREPKVSEGFFNPDFRNGDQLAREYNEQNEEAFREQYEFFKLVRAAKRSNFMTDVEIIKLLKDRVGTKTATNILSGRFTPLSYSKDALKSRYENVKRGNPDELLLIQDFLPYAKLENVKNKWKMTKFEDFERQQKEPEQPQQPIVSEGIEPVSQAPLPKPLPDTPSPNITATPVTPDLNPLTGLTTTETALLSPGEAAIRQKQRATGVV